MGNRLRNETSPYLKQHAENPVEWYPWGPEALEKAKHENKPILLSVGYSACHWCHVMAHESFENAEIAALMNENFVNIKVDREERPDLDHIYQNVAQAITRSGGWPLTVFLLPDQRPFFGGTYFPPEDRYGRPGFPRVLRSLSEAYRVDRDSVEENAEKLTSIIAQLERNENKGTSEEGEQASSVGNDDHFTFLREAAEGMLAGVDWKEGGFGGAPKFPNTLMLSYLWRIGNDSRAPSEFQEAALSAVLLALTKMAKGGIYDQLGGGFHRYAVDDHWAVPHFEKMLYDNGLLLQLYSEVLATDRVRRIMAPETRALFLRTVDRTVDYLLREMEDGGGGFYAAQDADSEGEEGKFFVWDTEELAKILTPEEVRVFSARYGVDATGNFEHGKTVLYQARTEEEVATRLALRSEDVRALLASAERKVFQEREKRIRPGLDDKILVGWNGLLISGLVWAAHALGEEFAENAAKAKASAERAFRRLAVGERLPASIQKGSAKGSGFLDDYAFLTRAAVDLLRFSDPGDLERKKELLLQSEGWITRIFDQFYDPSGDPGFFFTAKDQETLLQRPKSLYDQAIPSGTSVALSCAIVLGEVLSHLPEDALPECELEARAQDAKEHLKRLEPMLAANPYGYGELASALLLSDVGLRVFGGPGAEALVSSDRDFCFSSHLFAGAETGRLQVCELGTCREFANVQEWARSP